MIAEQKRKPLVKLPKMMVVSDGLFDFKILPALTKLVPLEEIQKEGEYHIMSNWGRYLDEFGNGTYLAVRYHTGQYPLAEVISAPDEDTLERLVQETGNPDEFVKARLGRRIDRRLAPFPYIIKNYGC